MSSDEILSFINARLDEDEQVAREASRKDEHGTATGEHWHWVETNSDQPVPPDPLTEEFVGENADSTGRIALRSVEEYPTNLPYTLPHFIVPYAEEVPAVCGLHIARHDPARVLAEVDAKRRMLAEHPRCDCHDGCTACTTCGDGSIWPCSTILLLALPHAGHPDYRPDWRPA